MAQLCQACEDGDHFNCGMQTWCACDCDPENCEPLSFGYEDEGFEDDHFDGCSHGVGWDEDCEFCDRLDEAP